ncbi:helicase associated domain-containing protein [Streptomyces sp. A1136]|uniref:helicase associated domain-containing protein n=1 Tax=Streptomyces sp. A1136 TaxID=2563102 RepID=UPI0027959288|nr:helicase associated domain-containing protein [Streptomyces sp. A1136]
MAGHPTPRLEAARRRAADPPRPAGRDAGCGAGRPGAAAPGVGFGVRRSAFERGVDALAQYAARDGRVVVPRTHTEELPDGTPVRLGVWLSNTRTRRDELTAEQCERLAALGVDWAR